MITKVHPNYLCSLLQNLILLANILVVLPPKYNKQPKSLAHKHQCQQMQKISV